MAKSKGFIEFAKGPGTALSNPVVVAVPRDHGKEDGTVDELGIGSIRGALADSLFPGTSVLPTRRRYVLFIPWLMEQDAHNATLTEMTAEFRNLEFRLINSLLAGGERLGVDRQHRRPPATSCAACCPCRASRVWKPRSDHGRKHRHTVKFARTVNLEQSRSGP